MTRKTSKATGQPIQRGKELAKRHVKEPGHENGQCPPSGPNPVRQHYYLASGGKGY